MSPSVLFRSLTFPVALLVVCVRGLNLARVWQIHALGSSTSDNFEAVERSAGRHHVHRSWTEASELARNAVESLTTDDLHSLVRGSHFSFTSSPERGYYVGFTPPLSSVRLPALKMQDAGQGFRTTEPGTAGTTTAWPCLLALASTWDEHIVRSVAAAIGREFKGKGANVVLGPSINVHRSSLGGRNFEYLSGEDPYLGARMATAYITGMQSQGVMAVAKHFAFNEQETNRMSMNAVVDDRTSWELYFPPFEAAVEAGVGAFMCAYNKVNGTYSCANPKLLNEVLRKSMGFQGFVMSDWGATHNLSDFSNGLDQEMPGQVKIPIPGIPDFGVLVDGQIDKLDEQTLKTSATRILTSMYRLDFDQDRSCTPPECTEELKSQQVGELHSALAVKAASAALTLLKNEDGILPLNIRKIKKLALFGRAAFESKYLVGGGSGYVDPGETVISAYDAIKARTEQAGVRLLVPDSLNSTLSDAIALADASDVVVIIAGAESTEGADRTSLALSDLADDLIMNISARKPTIVLLQTPGAVLTPWRHQVKAIANLFYGGSATGNVWASFLFGDILPSGRLPIQFPETEDDVIEIGYGSDVIYSEGLFTSYRSPKLKAAFPFGHGLSYTHFQYSNPVRDIKDCPDMLTCVMLNITNTGSHDGSEIVQAYIHFLEPFGGDSSLSLQTPKFFLKGFQKTRLLTPSSSEEVTFVFSEKDMSLYHPEVGWTQHNDVEISFGASSADIRQTLRIAHHP
jgi:beta-glucosidase